MGWQVHINKLPWQLINEVLLLQYVGVRDDEQKREKNAANTTQGKN